MYRYILYTVFHDSLAKCPASAAAHCKILKLFHGGYNCFNVKITYHQIAYFITDI